MARELLFSISKKDFKIDWYSGTGAGGQNRNKHANYCRLTHIESGAIATGQDHKEQKSNLRDAFSKIQQTMAFKSWHSIKIREMLEAKTTEQVVDEMMSDENLRVEVKVNGKWQLEVKESNEEKIDR